MYSSYGHHMGNWNMLEQKAGRWAKFWKKELGEQILYAFIFHALL